MASFFPLSRQLDESQLFGEKAQQNISIDLILTEVHQEPLPYTQGDPCEKSVIFNSKWTYNIIKKVHEHLADLSLKWQIIHSLYV